MKRGKTFVILKWVGNLKKNKTHLHGRKKKKKSASANIVPFIKAFKPNMKPMHDAHIWPTDIHIHDTLKSHAGLFFSTPPNVLFQRSR